MKSKETPDETIARQQELLDQAYSVIRSLADKLDDAEETIIHLMPEEIQELFRGYWHCESEKDTYRWQNDVTVDESLLKEMPFFFNNEKCY